MNEKQRNMLERYLLMLQVLNEPVLQVKSLPGMSMIEVEGVMHEFMKQKPGFLQEHSHETLT